MSGRYGKAGTEPPLHELMADEVVRLVMRRDGLTPAIVWAHVECAQARLRAREARTAEPVRRCA
ncbi:hypothetical protein [Caenispirillum bisanense]|uniref:hypothetical protein n=1 Tax=Caenispirillum bisanense TaxID=414052 RepID=UPI0031D9E09D